MQICSFFFLVLDYGELLYVKASTESLQYTTLLITLLQGLAHNWYALTLFFKAAVFYHKKRLSGIYLFIYLKRHSG